MLSRRTGLGHRWSLAQRRRRLAELIDELLLELVEEHAS
jgi:hypothetical protein